MGKKRAKPQVCPARFLAQSTEVFRAKEITPQVGERLRAALEAKMREHSNASAVDC